MSLFSISHSSAYGTEVNLNVVAWKVKAGLAVGDVDGEVDGGNDSEVGGRVVGGRVGGRVGGAGHRLLHESNPERASS